MPFTAAFRLAGSDNVVERLFASRANVPEVLTAANDPERKLKRGEEAVHVPFFRGPTRQGHAKYPIISTSLAVSPKEVPEARRRWGCDFTPSGRAIITSRRHRLSINRASGYCEMS